ncbi:MAG: hypothetical protein EOP48_10060 [Sphingobacteriales bacterium]|nr:MAG: hypothetical protein EOP48_10060 [Sphingobacteriales bacterium]
MATIQIDLQNLATTRRPDEFKGSIALDHHTHGQLLDKLLSENINEFLQDGYHFVGAQVFLGDSVRVTQQDLVSIKFILSNNSDKLFSVNRDVRFSQFLLCFTDISFQFSNRLAFEGDEINWESVEDIDEQQD